MEKLFVWAILDNIVTESSETRRTNQSIFHSVNQNSVNFELTTENPFGGATDNSEIDFNRQYVSELEFNRTTAITAEDLTTVIPGTLEVSR